MLGQLEDKSGGDPTQLDTTYLGDGEGNQISAVAEEDEVSLG